MQCHRRAGAGMPTVGGLISLFYFNKKFNWNSIHGVSSSNQNFKISPNYWWPFLIYNSDEIWKMCVKCPLSKKNQTNSPFSFSKFLTLSKIPRCESVKNFVTHFLAPEIWTLISELQLMWWSGTFSVCSRQNCNSTFKLDTAL